MRVSSSILIIGLLEKYMYLYLFLNTNHFLLIRHSSARSFISIINIIYSNSNIPSTSQHTIDAGADKHPKGHKYPERHSLAYVYLGYNCCFAEDDMELLLKFTKKYNYIEGLLISYFKSMWQYGI
jgi:hypothetical protein